MSAVLHIRGDGPCRTVLRFLNVQSDSCPLAVSVDGATIADCALERAASTDGTESPRTERQEQLPCRRQLQRYDLGLCNCRLLGWDVLRWDTLPATSPPSTIPCDGRCRAAVWAALRTGQTCCPVGSRAALARRMRCVNFAPSMPAAGESIRMLVPVFDCVYGVRWNRCAAAKCDFLWHGAMATNKFWPMHAGRLWTASLLGVPRQPQ
eukprot:SAG31_NODE_625_length_13462_cov_3.785153_3_plen_208_part_00